MSLDNEGWDTTIAEIRAALLAWYDRRGRSLPWREEGDPYRIWLAEVMLQQTRVETVIPYYRRFLQTYPDLASLSAAGEGEVLKLWEGLGYYARARHFLEAVKEVQASYGGKVPGDAGDFGKLPGVGEYTRAAVLSIAHNQPLAAVDGNIRRVITRLFCLEGEAGKPASQKAVKEGARELLDRQRPGDFNQALMDLGAALCIPQNPRCPGCPLEGFCLARRRGKAALLPAKKPRKDLPREELTALLIGRGNRYLVRQRPRKGLLGGLWEFPLLGPQGLSPEQVCMGDEVTVLHHQFSHLCWRVSLRAAKLEGDPPRGPDWCWAGAPELEKLPFPAVYHPVVSKILSPRRDKGQKNKNFPEPPAVKE